MNIMNVLVYFFTSCLITTFLFSFRWAFGIVLFEIITMSKVWLDYFYS